MSTDNASQEYRANSIEMVKIKSINVLTRTVVCYIICSSIAWLAQAGINCSNLTSVCPNRPVILTCKAPHLPVQWQHRDSIPKLFKDITLRGNSVEGHKEYYDGFVATVVKKNIKFVLTSLEFSPNSSYEHGNIRCEYEKSTNEKCTIRYEYLSKYIYMAQSKSIDQVIPDLETRLVF